MKFRKFFIIPLLIVLIACVLVSPAMAGTKYLSGGPSLSAAVTGTNELISGQTVPLQVTVQNSGLIDSKFSQTGLVDRTDLPNTAKTVTVGLGSGSAPVTIQSDPQMIGDILGGASGQSKFNVKVEADAPSGTYTLPVSVNYTYLESAEQVGTDSLNYNYVTKSLIIPLTVTIRSEVIVDVQKISAEQLNVGTEGYLNLTLQNTGNENGKNAIVKIVRNGASPITPTDSSVYIGDFAKGAVVNCRYRVAVSTEAAAQTYPVDVIVAYEDHDGINRTSRLQTIGVPIGGKIDFKVSSEAPSINPGQKKVLDVQYTNVGATTVYSAQARLSAVDPFTSNDDTAYLGDIKPGDSVMAHFEVSTTSDATIKQYGLDSEIRYRDALDNSQISDTMKVPVNVVAKTGTSAILGNPIILAVIAAIIIGVGYFLYTRKKQN
ncbi:COG1361 S-layer family protein [Methanosphaerula palustris]|uniref:S-layer-like domain-containing protein n=1 Tax=Methanosphaerula palustris (strain ATCC BAA-1556 / DSM 19958 / E1-9c) TaxID=521011 RepID=B8GHD4_METPE|nr:hypothetical protein [Methanosphaerula palustris]ACL16539.1 S-layer-like domain-containing protein [Methanosphaerula palustris E1-9c]